MTDGEIQFLHLVQRKPQACANIYVFGIWRFEEILEPTSCKCQQPQMLC